MITAHKDNGVFVAFLDISKAYDTVWREGLWHKMAKIGLSGTILSVIRNMYNNVQAFVRGAGANSSSFSIAAGLRQGSVLSPLLYNIFINGLVQELKKNTAIGINVNGKRSPCCLFADDIAIVGVSAEALEEGLRIASQYAAKWRFRFGIEKSKVVIFTGKHSRSHHPPTKWTLGDKQIETTQSYKYLGTWLSADLRWKEEADSTIASTRRKMGMLWASGLLDKTLTIGTRKHLLETLILPGLIYGADVVSFAGENSGAKTAGKSLQRRWTNCARAITATNWAYPESLALATLGWKPLDFYRDKHIISIDSDTLPGRTLALAEYAHTRRT